MFEDEDIGVYHSSAPSHERSKQHQPRHQLRTTHSSNPSLASSTSSTAFNPRRRSAIQITNPDPDQLEGDRIDPDPISPTSPDDIDFTPNPTTTTPYPVYTRQQQGGRAARRHPAVERSPYCQALDRSVNRPFVCLWPHTVDGHRAPGPVEGMEERGAPCVLDFATRQACENHIRSRHTYEKLKCSYPSCGYAHTDIQNLNKHERSHIRPPTAVLPRLEAAGTGLRMRSV